MQIARPNVIDAPESGSWGFQSAQALAKSNSSVVASMIHAKALEDTYHTQGSMVEEKGTCSGLRVCIGLKAFSAV